MTLPRVLVVDDDRAIRDLVKRVICRQGFVIDTATGGQKPGAIAENVYDAVLLDLMMPNMNGFDLVQRLRHEKPSLLPRIVVRTGFSRAGKIVDGVHSILRKPFDIGELLESVNAVVQEKK